MTRKRSFDKAMAGVNRDQLKELFHKLAEELDSFETGPTFDPDGADTGFYNSSSGLPLTVKSVKRRFLKIGSIACKAAAKASEYSARREAVEPSGTEKSK